MRPLWSPVPAWMPILLGSGLLWPEPGAGLQHSTHTHTQKHTHSTPGVIAFQPQGLDFCHHSLTNHPATHKKASGPQRERGPVPSSSSNLCSVTSNASELLLPYSHWIWTKGRKEDEGKESGEKKKKKREGRKGRDGKKERDGRKKETFRFFHLVDYDKWPGL